ncbi:hypothetical protein PLICRDRAFT_110410 [Plicaturopsis crispa FD-325 SS-3]|nr:hypothetical protein PLICRDRAFT_110410 [Plicaturopsis crispa FD-325 SS-3]
MHAEVDEDKNGASPPSEQRPRDLDYEEREEVARRNRLPWWRRPSSLWLMVALPFCAISVASTIAPRLDIYTRIACSTHKPELIPPLRHLSLPPDGDEMMHGPSSMSSIVAARREIITARIFLPRPTPRNFDVDGEPRMQSQLHLERDKTTETDTYSACTSDPTVQAAVAKLSTVMSTAQGILSCLTTSWWSSLSDRIGRARVLGICILGLVVADLAFILVAAYGEFLPGGYWLFIFSALVDGSLGGLSTANAAMQAYAADCTEPSARSRTFSTLLGLLFIGMGAGPTVGALIIRATPDHNPIAALYFATFLHICYATFLWMVLPESLSPARMRAAREARARQDTHAYGLGTGFAHRFMLVLRQGAADLLGLLSVVVPTKRAGVSSPTKISGRDWSLSLVVIANGVATTIAGSSMYVMQYAPSTFGWTSEFLGYWISFVGVTRALFLTVVLPFIIKLLKAKYFPDHKSSLPSEPVYFEAATSLSGSPPSPSSDTPSSTSADQTHSSRFDLNLALASLSSDTLSFIFIGLSTSTVPFVISTMLLSLGSGMGPAVQSVALDLYTRRDGGSKKTGKLFAALNVIESLSSSIVGPAIFGLIYINTVGTMPNAIFFVAVGANVIAIILLRMVWLPALKARGDLEGHGRDETLVGVGVGGDGELGEDSARHSALIRM